MEIIISGASGDLIEIDGDIREEYNVIEDGPYIAKLIIGGRLAVHVLYDGCWSFAPCRVEEDIPIPESWEIEFGKVGDREYSTSVTVRTDEKVHIQLVRRGE